MGKIVSLVVCIALLSSLFIGVKPAGDEKLADETTGILSEQKDIAPNPSVQNSPELDYKYAHLMRKKLKPAGLLSDAKETPADTQPLVSLLPKPHTPVQDYTEKADLKVPLEFNRDGVSKQSNGIKGSANRFSELPPQEEPYENDFMMQLGSEQPPQVFAGSQDVVQPFTNLQLFSRVLRDWNIAISNHIVSAYQIGDLNADGTPDIVIGYQNLMYSATTTYVRAYNGATGALLWQRLVSGSRVGLGGGMAGKGIAIGDIYGTAVPEVVLITACDYDWGYSSVYLLNGQTGVTIFSKSLSNIRPVVNKYGVAVFASNITGSAQLEIIIYVLSGSPPNGNAILFALNNTGSVIWSQSLNVCLQVAGENIVAADADIGEFDGTPNYEFVITALAPTTWGGNTFIMTINENGTTLRTRPAAWSTNEGGIRVYTKDTTGSGVDEIYVMFAWPGDANTQAYIEAYTNTLAPLGGFLRYPLRDVSPNSYMHSMLVCDADTDGTDEVVIVKYDLETAAERRIVIVSALTGAVENTYQDSRIVGVGTVCADFEGDGENELFTSLPTMQFDTANSQPYYKVPAQGYIASANFDALARPELVVIENDRIVIYTFYVDVIYNDWIIDGSTVSRTGQSILVKGSIIIKNGGVLNLQNCFVKVENNIAVQAGSSMNCVGGSMVIGDIGYLWVSGTVSYTDATVTQNGNTIVNTTGSLTIEGTWWYMNPSFNGEYRFEVYGTVIIQNSATRASNITRTATSTAAYEFWVDGGAIAFANSSMHYCGWRRFVDNYKHTGLWINTDNYLFWNVTITDNFFGVVFWQRTNLLFINNRIESCVVGLYHRISVTTPTTITVTVQRNTFYSNVYGIYNYFETTVGASDLSASATITFQDNDIINNFNYGIVVRSLLQGTSSGGGIFQVTSLTSDNIIDGRGAGGDGIYLYNHVTTGVNAVKPCYNNHTVQINNNIITRCWGGILLYDYAYSSASATTAPAFSKIDVTITNNNITDNDDGIYSYLRSDNSDINYRSDTTADIVLKVENNRIEGNRYGIYGRARAYSGRGNATSNLLPLIGNNTFSNNKYGIYLDTYATPLPPRIYFSDDMEGGVGGWTENTIAGVDSWHQVTTTYHSPVTSWWFGNDALNDQSTDVQEAVLRTPMIDLTTATAPRMTFWHRYHFEFSTFGNYATEGGWVEIATSPMGPWTTIEPIGGYPMKTDDRVGPTNTIVNYVDGSQTTPNAGHVAFLMDSGGWVQETFDLSPYAGNRVWLRFYYSGGVYTEYNVESNNGWWIDDVTVFETVGVVGAPFAQSKAQLYNNDISNNTAWGIYCSDPYSTADWLVDSVATARNNPILLRGNISVYGGTFTMQNVNALQMGCSYRGEYWIDVDYNGTLNVLDGTNITALTPTGNYNYLFMVWQTGSLVMRNSELHYCGFDSRRLNENGLFIYSLNVTIDRNLISNNFIGIITYYSSIPITNNTIEANTDTGIYAYQEPAPVILNNTIRNHNAIFAAGIVTDRSNALITQTNRIYNNYFGTFAYRSSPTITYNTIENNNGPAIPGYIPPSGIVCARSASPTIRYNIINNNRDGIFAYYFSNPPIRNNVFTNNVYGLECFVVANPAISSNRINGNTYGIYSFLSAPTISANDIASNTYGVYCELYDPLIPAAPTVTNNNITGPNQQYGVYCLDSDATITNNNILGPGQTYGIFTRHSAPTISNNKIKANVFGIFSTGSSASTIVQNRFAENTNCGIYTESYTDMPAGIKADLTGTPTPYKVVYLAFAYESIVGATARNDVMRTLLDWLESPVGAYRVLLVDDDGGTDDDGNPVTFETYYKNALTALGVGYDIWRVNESGSPDLVALQASLGFRVVIWFTGSAVNPATHRSISAAFPTLSATDRANIQNYLNNGGRLLISGQDIGYDIGRTAFYRNYLHATFVDRDANIFWIGGVKGEITAGLSLDTMRGREWEEYPDVIQPVNDGYTSTIFVYKQDAYPRVSDNQFSLNNIGIRVHNSAPAVELNTLSENDYGLYINKMGVLGNIRANVIDRGTIGIEVWNSKEFSISENTISNATDTGILLSDCTDLQIVRNNIIYNLNTGVKTQTPTLSMTTANIVNDNFIGNGDGDPTDAGIYVGAKANITIENCDFVNNNRYGIVSAVASSWTNWKITSSVTSTNNMFRLRGNITVLSGGSLRMSASAVSMYSDTSKKVSIDVLAGGTFIADRSAFTAFSPGIYYYFNLYGGADITDSTIAYAWQLFIGSRAVTVTYSEIYRNANNGVYTVASARIAYNKIHDNNFGDGAGVYCTQGSMATIVSNELYANYHGVFCNNSKPTLHDNFIYSNNLYGIYAFNCEVTVTDNFIRNNEEGIYVENSINTVIASNRLHDNFDIGINLINSVATLKDNEIVGDTTAATYRGVGIRPFASTVTINDELTYTRHAVYAVGSSVTIRDSTMINNYDSIILFNSILKTVNCTLSAAALDLHLVQGSAATILNTVYTSLASLYVNDTSVLTIQWFLHVYIMDSFGVPVSGAVVTVTNKFGTAVGTTTTDKTGYARWFVCTMLVQTSTSTTYHTPHKITVAGVTLYRLADVTSTQTVVFDNPPVIQPIPSPQAAVEDQLYSYHVGVVDVDVNPVDTLSYTLISAPAGMTIDSSGVIKWTPKGNQAGNHTVIVKVDDGYLYDTASFTIYVGEVNHVPTVISVPVQTAYEGTTYVYDIIAADADLPQDYVTFTLVEGPAGMKVVTINSTAGIGKVVWDVPPGLRVYNVCIQVTDSHNAFNYQTYNITVKDANYPPSITAVKIQPAVADTTTNLTALPEGWYDADNDPPNYKYRWLIQYGGTGNWVEIGNSAVLTADKFARGDKVMVEVTPWDGIAEGLPVVSEALTISNAKPVVVKIEFQPGSPRTNDDLKAIPTGFDADNDTLTYTYKWYKNNVLIEGATTDTLSAKYFVKGDTIVCTVVAYDSIDYGRPESASVVIANSPPVVLSVVIQPPLATKTTPLIAAVTSSDADNDAVTYKYQWQKYVNANWTDIEGAVYNFYTDQKKGEKIRVVVTPYDNEDYGIPTASEPITILNAPPMLTDTRVEPQIGGDTETEYVFKATYIDPDGDEGTVTLYIDGKAYEMTADGGEWTTGRLFTYSTKLSGGHHTYYFEASDKVDKYTTLAATFKVGVAINWLLIGVVVLVIACAIAGAVYGWMRKKKMRAKEKEEAPPKVEEEEKKEKKKKKKEEAKEEKKAPEVEEVQEAPAPAPPPTPPPPEEEQVITRPPPPKIELPPPPVE